MTKNLQDKKNIFSRTFHVQTAGCQLRVKRIEPEPGTLLKDRSTLVFLHEGLGCIEIWRDFPKTLCESTGCSGLVYDRRGYGGSEIFEGPWPVDYLETESSRYLPALLKECDIDNAVLIGHSDGGTIALITAASHSNLVRGIITEAAHIFVEQITIEGIRRAVEAFETTSLKEKFIRYHKEHTETIFYRWANRWLSPEFSNWNIQKDLSKITCPVLVLQGEDDAYGTPDQVKGIARQVSGPVRVKLIPDCGHTPHFQAKDTVLSEIKRFIEGLF
ncbi:MAG: alpha/beta hydrolase [Deltaproteobacteria bacterium]|nr:alpha/beta hydrolase [Deltaproteobacteria bacterium]